MSLVFAAITPHPPLLLPSIGKEEAKKAEKTKQALEKLEEDLYISRPDLVIVISPHGSYFNDAFSVNIAPEFETDLRDFGDLTTKLKYKGEMAFSTSVYEFCKEHRCPLAMVSERHIDYGTAIPLYFLAQHLQNFTVMPLGFSDLDRKSHVDFGYMLKDKIMESTKRIAVIASGDMSQALTSESPAGFNAAGAEFDRTIQDLLASGNTAGMLQMDEKLVGDAAECGYRAFLILMGILRDINFTYRSYSYESPFGVGYLTANFII